MLDGPRHDKRFEGGTGFEHGRHCQISPCVARNVRRNIGIESGPRRHRQHFARVRFHHDDAGAQGLPALDQLIQFPFGLNLCENIERRNDRLAVLWCFRESGFDFDDDAASITSHDLCAVLTANQIVQTLFKATVTEVVDVA